MIESLYNERVKNWTKLNDKKYQETSGLFLVEGEHLVEEAKKCGHLKETIVLDGYEYPYKPCTTVSLEVMKKISNLVNPPKIIGVVNYLTSREARGPVLLLDRIGNPGNLGTIIRSAAAFGIDTIILSSDSVSIYNPKVVRATEGLIFHINIVVGSLKKEIEKLKCRDYKIYATDVQGGTLLENRKFSNKTAIVIGSEASGVDSEIKDLCDDYIYIEMNSKCESLNVGIATSIVLYELAKKLRIK